MSVLRVPGELEIGAVTHVGRVRTANEDDYLIAFPEEGRDGGFVAIADGMGGVAGGAQASRAAIRALGATLADAGPESDPGDRLRAAFDAASERVHALESESPHLAGMGTTMTVLLFDGDRAFVGHVGDTRCSRIRSGTAEQLTEDHAMREPRNLLTRAIGAGQRHETVDVLEVDVQPGDTFVLCTDGVWSVVEPSELAQDLRAAPLQRACERVLSRVWDREAPDNATLVAVRIQGEPVRANRETDLPPAEARIRAEPSRAERRGLGAARWPLVLLGASVLLVVLAWLRVFQGIDLVAVVRSWLG